ncbi:endonuclease domain-containing protein [Sphingomonas sp. RB56-2]|uniref:Endonuclease domain-containing protein n=2 Tax=Sphingomonas brevis TaxID=2908206 RepID=A0ABT0S756_9SPHN|nr:endonuclease domain-containing protein [Sphingomonas brevis]
MTLPEVLLWRELRRRPGSLKFRRQHPFGRCIVDFYCPAARLVIEIDGMAHQMGSEADRDRRRDSWLRSQGLHVARFAVPEVMNDLEAVVREIVRTALSRLPLHQAALGSPPQDRILGRN